MNVILKSEIFIIILVIVTAQISIFPQKGIGSTINGYIYNLQGEVLSDADIHIEGSHKGAKTNLMGFFTIWDVPLGEQILQVSFVGYKNQSHLINVKKADNAIIKIFLEEDIVEKQEVVIKDDSVLTIEKMFMEPVSTIILNADQINNIPQLVSSDLFRTLQTMPGVQSLSDFSSSLYVRGGTPDQNLYLLDGIEVYNPEHAFGLFSIFNTSEIQNVELSKGGFGAEYGGRLSSVLNVTNYEGDRNNFKGEININLISAAATIQAPLGSFGSFSGSFRRTFIDQTFAKVVNEIPDYYFYDGNFKAYFDLGEKDKLTFSFFDDKDRLNYVFDKKMANSVSFLYDWGNTTAGLNWIKVFSPDIDASFGASVSSFRSNFNFPDADFLEINKILDYTLKGNVEYCLNYNLKLKFGFENKILSGSLNEILPGSLVDIFMYRNQYSGFLSSSYNPLESLGIELGLRYDFFRSDKNYQNLDPRFTIRYRLSELSNLKFSAGIYHQYLNQIPRLFLTSIWTSADQYSQGSFANHFIIGYQRKIDPIYLLDIELYYKRYFDIYSFNQNYLADIVPDYYNGNGEPVFTSTKNLYLRGDSKAMGMEFLLRKDLGALTGWIGYSYSFTRTETDGTDHNLYYSPRQDRTHTLNFTTNLNINDFINEFSGKSGLVSNSKWSFGMNFIYASGQPVTIPGYTYFINPLPDWDNSKYNVNLYPSSINSARLPAYIRMDVSVSWEKKYDGWTLAPYLQIFNVGNRKNTWFISYDSKIATGIVQDIVYHNMMPIVPSLGINIKF
ncbi:MAG: TonB-dependent receptor [Ignavibacteriaceae bacterium]|nr:TonB-dependent receptor [Ignavibacteriaceae bacterium]